MNLRPWYNKDANYQTNAKSFMDYLARTNKFLEVLIEDYEIFQELVIEELKRIKFDSEIAVDDIFYKWLEDGTLENILNEKLLHEEMDVFQNEFQEKLNQFIHLENQKMDVFQNNIQEKLNQVKQLENWELNSWKRKKQPLILFHSDDGHIADWDYTKPIFDQHDVPLTISVTTDFIGQPNYLNIDQIKELENNGWEISSHGLSHVPLRNVSLTEAERQLKESKEYLESHGITVENFAYPHGSYNNDILKMAKKYYRSGRIIAKGLNKPPLATLALRTDWISTLQNDVDSAGNSINTFAYYKRLIDEAVRNEEVAIISFHSRDIFINADYTDLLNQVVSYAKQQAPVVTYNEMLNRVGNIVDIGVYNPQGVGGDEDFYVMGVNGEYKSSNVDFDYTLNTPPYDLPSGVTSVRVMSEDPHLSKAPLNSMGLLTTYKGTRQLGGQGYIFQEYRLFESNFIYKRYGIDNSWSTWKRSDLLTIDNERTPNSPFHYFRAGITMTIVDSNNEGLSSAPKGKTGLMITYSPADGSRIGYSRQEYTIASTNEVYTRYYTEDGWGGWEKNNQVTVSDKNENTIRNGIAVYPAGISYKVVTGEDPDIGLTPNNKRGTLITHKTQNSNAQLGYNFQEFLEIETSRKYVRYPETEQTWNSWVLMNS